MDRSTCLMLFSVFHLANEHTHATRVTDGLELLFSGKEGCRQTGKSIQGTEGTITQSMNVNPEKLKLQ